MKLDLERFCDAVDLDYSTLTPDQVDDKEFASQLSSKKGLLWKPLLFSMRNTKLKNTREALQDYKLLTQNQLERYLQISKKTEKKYFSQ